MKICITEGCQNKNHAKGYCSFHYPKLDHVKKRMNEVRRQNYSEKNKEWSRNYEKTKRGLLMRTYRNMISRVTGIQKKKAHLYKGLELLSKEQFYSWAANDPAFNRLWFYWTESKHDRKLAPSINRIDPKMGYIMGNIEWVTHSENSKLGNYNRHKNTQALFKFK